MVPPRRVAPSVCAKLMLADVVENHIDTGTAGRGTEVLEILIFAVDDDMGTISLSACSFALGMRGPGNERRAECLGGLHCDQSEIAVAAPTTRTLLPAVKPPA